MDMPNTYAWMAMVSKFKPEIQATWPQDKSQPAAKQGGEPAKKGAKDGDDKPQKQPDMRG